MYAVVLAWMVIPTTSGNQWTLGGNTDNVRIIYNSATSLLSRCQPVSWPLLLFKNLWGRSAWVSTLRKYLRTVLLFFSTVITVCSWCLQSWVSQENCRIYLSRRRIVGKKNKLVALLRLKFLALASLTISDDERHSSLYTEQGYNFEDWCRRKRVQGNKGYVMSPTLPHLLSFLQTDILQNNVLFRSGSAS